MRRCNRCEKPASKLHPLAFCRLLNVSSSRTPSSIPSPSTACLPPNRCSVRVSWTPSSPARVRPLCSALARPAHMCTPTHRKNPRDPNNLKGFHETSALPVVCLNATRVLLPDPSANHDLAHVYLSPEHHQFRAPVFRCLVSGVLLLVLWSLSVGLCVLLKCGAMESDVAVMPGLFRSYTISGNQPGGAGPEPRLIINRHPRHTR